MGGRGASYGTGRFKQAPTKARSVENMNEAQLDLEISRAERVLAAATQQRKMIAEAAFASDADLREAFPLGTAGLNRTQANKMAGQLSEQSLNNGRKLSAAIDKQENAQKRLDVLKKAKGQVKNTGKTAKQLQETPKASNGTMKWSTVQKQSYSGGVLQPRIIKSGSFEIRGSSVLRVYENGKHIGTASTLSAAKSIAEKQKKK